MRNIHLKRGKTGPIRAGHPWVFAGSVDKISGHGTEDVVQVLGDRGDRLGIGLWSANSTIRVRMLGDLEDFDAAGLRTRIDEAQGRRVRQGITARTEVYRCVNSEGDGLPGLSVDCFGPNLVTFIASTLPMFERRAEIATALGSIFAGAAILERPAPESIARLEGFEPVERWHTDALADPVTVLEHGVRHVIDPAAMQKTGHYADMRDERRWVGEMASGRSMLDAYCYTGGFGLQAMAGGAERVVAVDSSRHAIEGVLANAAANEFEIATHVGDVGDFLRSAFDRGERFDIVVLDPPKLAPRKQHVSKALKVYEAIAVQAARIVNPGGMLCIGSCSEAIGAPDLERVFTSVTERVGRATRVVRTAGQPGDHPYPAAMSEGRYLTFMACLLD